MVRKQLNVKTVPFQTIQLSTSTQFSSIWPIDQTLSGAATPGQSGPECNGDEGVLCISQSSSMTGTSPSDCCHILGTYWGVLPSANMQSVYSRAFPQSTGQPREGVHRRTSPMNSSLILQQSPHPFV